MSATAYLRYGALSTKVRALYGKRLTDDDFRTLSRCHSVEEVLEYLRVHPGWRGALSALPTGFTGRLELERSLAAELDAEYHALGHFISPNDKQFWAFLPHLRTLGRLLAKYKTYQTGADLRAAAAGTIYEKSLNQVTAGGKLPSLAATEGLLRTRYFSHMWRVITQEYDGASGRALQKMFGEAVDQLNLLGLLRLKQYFPAQAQELGRYIPVHHRLNQRLYGRLSAAATLEEAREILRESRVLAPYADMGLAELDLALHERMRVLLRSMIRSGEPSVAVAYAYLSYKELSMAQLYSVIETVKYQEKGGA